MRAASRCQPNHARGAVRVRTRLRSITLRFRLGGAGRRPMACAVRVQNRPFRSALHVRTPSNGSRPWPAAASIRAADGFSPLPAAPQARPQSPPASDPPGSAEPAPRAAASGNVASRLSSRVPSGEVVALRPARRDFRPSPPTDPCRAPAGGAAHRPTRLIATRRSQLQRVLRDFRSCPDSGQAQEKHPGQSLRPGRGRRSCAKPARRPSTGARQRVFRSPAASHGHKSLLPPNPQRARGGMQRFTRRGEKFRGSGGASGVSSAPLLPRCLPFEPAFFSPGFAENFGLLPHTHLSLHRTREFLSVFCETGRQVALEASSLQPFFWNQ